MGDRGSSSGMSLTMDNLIKLAVGEDSYVFDDEYKEMENEYGSLKKEYNELQKKRKELENELENEKTPMDDLYKQFMEDGRKDGFDDDVLNQSWREMKGMLQTYTERGKEIEKELRSIRGREDEVSRNMDRMLRKMNDYGKMRSENEFEYRNKPFTPLSQNDYKGFSLKQTVPYINEHLEKGTARIVEMTPKEYLQRVAHQVFNGKSTANAVQGTNPSAIAKYAKMMKKGTKFETPYLNLRDRNQEGRHRALAAIVNGYKKIPVIIVE